MGWKPKYVPETGAEREFVLARTKEQTRVAAIRILLERKTYQVDVKEGVVYGQKTDNQKKYKQVKATVVNGGYHQFTLQGWIDGRFMYVKVYGHQLVWLVKRGVFPVKGEIGFLNEDPADFRYENLYLKKEAEDPVIVDAPPSREYTTPVRRKEMARLRKLMREYPDLKASDASQLLKCSYSSTAYAMRGIKDGRRMRYGGKYDRDPAKRVESWMRMVTFVDWMGGHYLE